MDAQDFDRCASLYSKILIYQYRYFCSLDNPEDVVTEKNMAFQDNVDKALEVALASVVLRHNPSTSSSYLP